MGPTLVEQAASLRAALAGFDPAEVPGDEAAAVAEALALTEKACAAAGARAARRAAECGSHVRQGFADAPEWLARLRGCSRAESQVVLGVGAVEPDTALGTALGAGELSVAQAEVIRRVGRPEDEAELVALARGSSMAKLADEVRRRRMAGVEPAVLSRRRYAARRFAHWRDSDGMVCLRGSLPPEVGVRLMNRLERECDRRWRRAEGAESRAAYAADALVAMMEGQARGPSATDLVLVCDLAAWRRGHAHGGEVSHIIGGGPVEVESLRRLAQDAFLKVVLHEGVRIHTVAHLGRHIPAELRTALELGPPPGFEGVECVEEGCGRRRGLEWDHVDPLAHGGQTTADNLQPRCRPHHRAKTEKDRRQGLIGPWP